MPLRSRTTTGVRSRNVRARKPKTMSVTMLNMAHNQDDGLFPSNAHAMMPMANTAAKAPIVRKYVRSRSILTALFMPAGVEELGLSFIYESRLILSVLVRLNGRYGTTMPELNVASADRKQRKDRSGLCRDSCDRARLNRARSNGGRSRACRAPGSRRPMAHSWCRLAGLALVQCNIVPCRSQGCFVGVEPSHRPAQARAASRDLTSAVGRQTRARL